MLSCDVRTIGCRGGSGRLWLRQVVALAAKESSGHCSSAQPLLQQFLHFCHYKNYKEKMAAIRTLAASRSK